MKTLKLTMIIAILSFAMVTYAGIKPKVVTQKVVKISLIHALKTPGVAQAMSMQLKFSDLRAEPNGAIYFGVVEYHKVVYKIYGKRTDWIRFFLSSSQTGGVEPNGT